MVDGVKNWDEIQEIPMQKDQWIVSSFFATNSTYFVTSVSCLGLQESQ